MELTPSSASPVNIRKYCPAILLEHPNLAVNRRDSPWIWEDWKLQFDFRRDDSLATEG
jgi:hypothetical protein